MLKDITLGQYFPADTVVHRLDPRTKLLAVILYIVALFNANQNAMYYGPRMAVAVLSAIPLVILYLILQKHIVASIAVTGIKQ